MADEIIKKEQEFGSALVSEATKRHEDNRREALLADVAKLIAHRDESLERVRFYTKAAGWYSRKLKALEAGEFTFDPLTGTITPTDPELARANY